MKILKFGGTSLQDPDRIRAVAGIVTEARASSAPDVVVVVSALGGVTNALTGLAESAARGAPYDDPLGEFEVRHLTAVNGVAADPERPALVGQVQSSVRELRDLLQGVSLVGECSPRTRDRILSYGERLSARLVAAGLRARGTPAQSVDARECVVTDETFGAARVLPDATAGRIRERLADVDDVPVVTGFIAATPGGETTTLGRGGSDLTASLIGVALNAGRIEIWTDVDGLMSADPRLVPNAFSLPAVRYDELMELSHFGAKIVYPPTVHPAREHGIPIVLRNTLNPAFPGTVISAEAPVGDDLIRGVSSINRVALLRLEGDGMVGVPGIAARLFASLARAEINVILISQASSEHSICFALPPEAAEPARRGIDAEFDLERRAGLIDDVIVEEDFAVIAVVGAGMRERAGIAGRVFSVLGDRGVNVRAIAQGSSELSISLVLRQADERDALNAIHQAFFSERAVHA